MYFTRLYSLLWFTRLLIFNINLWVIYISQVNIIFGFVFLKFETDLGPYTDWAVEDEVVELMWIFVGEASNDQLLHRWVNLQNIKTAYCDCAYVNMNFCSNDDIPTLPKLKASFKRNPIIVQGMRQELMDLLDQKLETIGISKVSIT